MVLRVSALAELDQRPSAADATRSRAEAGVEAQVADVAPSVLLALGAELRDRGAEVDDADLETGFLHIELGERLRGALAAR